MEKIKSFKPSHLTHKAIKSFNGRANIDALYDENWEKYRLQFLEHNPRCYSCGVEAKVVDHITPHKGNIKLFWKMDNYIPLCHRCHNTVTSLFDRNHLPGHSINRKLNWLATNRARFLVGTIVKVVPFNRDILNLLFPRGDGPK